MKIGVIKEGKTPPDKRVPFSPIQCKTIKEKLNIDVVVQPSPIRCFTDKAYEEQGIVLQEDLSDCDYLFGVKEVKMDELIPGKKYFFFSHTIKEQPYNKALLQTLLANNNQMIDYECLRNEKGQRILGFGRYAGIVGSYNALLAWGKRNNSFELKPAHLCNDMDEIKQELKKIALSNQKIILTGGGRVAHGAVELLEYAGIKQVDPAAYLNQVFNETIFCRVDCHNYYYLGEGDDFSYPHFYKNSTKYQVRFKPYLMAADIFISCHYWDNESKILFELADCKDANFKTQVIADITCDIQGSVPTTIRSTTIADPLYEFDTVSETEVKSVTNSTITIMAVDNLPCELPKDASEDFGNALLEKVIPELLNNDANQIIDKASICLNGDLNSPYEYLRNYAS